VLAAASDANPRGRVKGAGDKLVDRNTVFFDPGPLETIFDVIIQRVVKATYSIPLFFLN
jgi:hypothetical protein